MAILKVLRKRWLLGLCVSGALAVPIVLIGLPNLVVYNLVSPKPHAIPPRSELGAYPVEEVTLTTSDGVALSGWHVRVPGTKAVVLLHGIAANRLQHLAKAELYTQLGYSVLLYDARGHGTSQDVPITGGWNERLDLEAAMAYMRGQGYAHVGANGFSMGAATIAFAEKDAVAPDFAVIESCYLDVDTLIHNAVAGLHLPSACAQPVLWRMSEKLGFSVEQMSPLNYLESLKAPTMMLLGDSEFQVSEAQAQRMFAACGAAQKEMHVFKKAGHEVFSQTQPELYKEYLSTFLAKVEKDWAGPAAIASLAESK